MLNEILLALLYGLVEGLTEFIPVSSTGHLILLADYLKDYEDRIKTFLIFIQGGAILAGLLYYRKRFEQFLTPDPSNQFSGFQGLIKLGIACIPASLIALIFHDEIKKYLFNSLSVALALIVGGLIFLIIGKKKDGIELEKISYKQSFIIGLMQCISLWPGFSRSGSVIIGGASSGLNLKSATDFAFILGVPLLLMASAYDLIKNFSALSFSDIPFFATGFISSFIFAYLSITIFLGILKRFSLLPFAIYRILLGLVILIVS